MIEGFHIRNYRALRDVTLGRMIGNGYHSKAKPLTSLVVVIGRNGTGKSTLFDAFGFLSDCLAYGVEEACYRERRGGFERLVSAGINEPILFEFTFRESSTVQPIVYRLALTIDRNRRPYVVSESLAQKPKGERGDKLFSFMEINGGVGVVYPGHSYEDNAANEPQEKPTEIELTDNRRLAIATLGNLKDHPRITRFKDFIQQWYLSEFHAEAARGLPYAGPQKHLNRIGDNLGNVVQYMEQSNPERFKLILEKIAAKIPGLDKIYTVLSPDGRLLLQFNNKGFNDPFYAQQMSDGTLKLFAYLLLLQDPEPPPFLCIEEPEKGLYHKLLETLAAEFREHTEGKSRSQLFITTHSPNFVDALSPDEVWVLEKNPDGFSTLTRASDDPVVQAMVEEGRPLGNLWYSDFLDAR